jgi:hypothetical protein
MVPTIAVLARVLDVRDVSRPYPDRPPSTLVRVYLDTTPRADREGADHG